MITKHIKQSSNQGLLISSHTQYACINLLVTCFNQLISDWQNVSRLLIS